MTRNEIAYLAFRVLGIWLLACAVANSASGFHMFLTMRPDPPVSLIGVALTQLVVPLAAGLSVWSLADWLANLVFPKRDTSAVTTNVTASQVYEVLLATIGIYLLVGSLPFVLSWLAMYVAAGFDLARVLGALGFPENPGDGGYVDLTVKADLCTNLAQMVFGGALFVGPGHIRRWSGALRKELAGPARLDEESEDAGKDRP